MTEVGKGVVMWATIAGALMTIIGAITYVVQSEFRPALAVELHEVEIRLAEGIKGVDRLATEQALNSNQLRLYQNQREQTQLKQDNLPIPDWLIKEQVQLESEKRRLERRLKDLD